MNNREQYQLKKLMRRMNRQRLPSAMRTGDGHGTNLVPGHPDMAFVRAATHDIPLVVYGGDTPDQENLHVLVGLDPNDPSVTRILDLSRNQGGGQSSIPPVLAHAPTHFLNGSDPLWVDLGQVVNLLATPNLLTVTVKAGWVIMAGQPVWVEKQTLTFTPPVTGALYSLIRANDAGVLSKQDGTPVDNLVGLAKTDIPAVAVGYVTLWAVRLYAGQTVISWTTAAPDLVDLRFATQGLTLPVIHHTTHESGGADEILFTDGLLVGGDIANYKDTYNYTGGLQHFVIPSGVYSLVVKIWGAAGGGLTSLTSQKGGGGGYATDTIAVTPGETIDIIVGGGGGVGILAGGLGGYGGGGKGGSDAAGYAGCYAAGGGGRSEISAVAGKVIAGAGGGRGFEVTYTVGAGGGSDGTQSDDPSARKGGYGTQIAGGAAGAPSGNAGAADTGGAGADAPAGNYRPGGGGGGGYYGGGGGGYVASNLSGSGGGGSGKLITGGGTLTAGSNFTPGNSGDADRGSAGEGIVGTGNHGRVVISYTTSGNNILINSQGDILSTADTNEFQGDFELSGGNFILSGDSRVVKDVQIPLSGFGKGAAAPATVYLGNYIGFEFTTNDEVYYSTEIPYDWDSSTDLIIEIHWYIDEVVGTPNKEIAWEIYYTCTKENGTEAVDSGSTTVASGDIVIPTVAKHLTQTNFTIPHAAIEADDVIGIIIKRVAIAGGTAPTAKPTMVGAMLEYTINKLGEAL